MHAMNVRIGFVGLTLTVFLDSINNKEEKQIKDEPNNIIENLTKINNK